MHLVFIYHSDLMEAVTRVHSSTNGEEAIAAAVSEYTDRVMASGMYWSEDVARKDIQHEIDTGILQIFANEAE